MALGRDNRRRKKRTLIVPVDDVPVPEKAKTAAAGELSPGQADRAPTIRMEPVTVGDADGDPSRRFVIKPPSQVLPPPSADDMLVDLEVADDELEPDDDDEREGSAQELNIDDLEEIDEEAGGEAPAAVITSPPSAPPLKPMPSQPRAAAAPAPPADGRVGPDPVAEPVGVRLAASGRSIDITVDDLEDDDLEDDETLDTAEGAAAAPEEAPRGAAEAEPPRAPDRVASPPPEPLADEELELDDEGEGDEEPPLLDLETGELTLSSRPEAPAGSAGPDQAAPAEAEPADGAAPRAEPVPAPARPSAPAAPATDLPPGPRASAEERLDDALTIATATPAAAPDAATEEQPAPPPAAAALTDATDVAGAEGSPDEAPPELDEGEDDEQAERDTAPRHPAEVDDDAPTLPPLDEIVARKAAEAPQEDEVEAVEPVIVGVIQVIGAGAPPAAIPGLEVPGPAGLFVPPPAPVAELERPFDDLGADDDDDDDRVTSERRLEDIEAALRAEPPETEDEAEELDLSEAEEVPEAQAAAGAGEAKKVAAPPRPATPASGTPAPPVPGGPTLTPPLPPGPAAERDTPSVSRRRRRKPWWEEIFNDDYLRSLPRYSPRQTQKEVDFIEAALGIKEGGMILDLACGNGRHAVELSSRGFQVVGLDLSLPMLARAAELAQKHGQKINFIHGDMRQIAFETTFDGAVCLGTSFGFFDDETNVKVIEGVRRALKARGMLIIETVNRDYVIGHQPNMVWFEGDGCVCMEESSFNFITSRLKVKRTLLLEGGRQVDHEFSIRVYCLHELGKILHNAGFRVIEVSGHIHTPGAFFGADSTDLVILAEKRLE